MAKGTLSIAGADTLTAADLAPDSVGSSEIAANAVTATEIADESITPNKMAYLGDGTGKLSGTITGQQLRIGTAFTLTDDLTVNGDLTLSKVRADGTGQSLTQDSSANRTLTGTGTLRMGSSMSSVEGMTGTLGVGVIPAGHIVQTTGINSGATSTNAVGSDTSMQTTVVKQTITPIYDDSAIIVHANFIIGIAAETTSDFGISVRWLKTGNGVTTAYPVGMRTNSPDDDENYSFIYRNPFQYDTIVNAHTLSLMDEDVEVAGVPVTYTLEVGEYGIDGVTLYVGSNGWGNYKWTVYLQEIKR